RPPQKVARSEAGRLPAVQRRPGVPQAYWRREAAHSAQAGHKLEGVVERSAAPGAGKRFRCWSTQFYYPADADILGSRRSTQRRLCREVRGCLLREVATHLEPTSGGVGRRVRSPAHSIEMLECA